MKDFFQVSTCCSVSRLRWYWMFPSCHISVIFHLSQCAVPHFFFKCWYPVAVVYCCMILCYIMYLWYYSWFLSLPHDILVQVRCQSTQTQLLRGLNSGLYLGCCIPHAHTCFSYNTWCYWFPRLLLWLGFPLILDLVEFFSEKHILGIISVVLSFSASYCAALQLSWVVYHYVIHPWDGFRKIAS